MCALLSRVLHVHMLYWQTKITDERKYKIVIFANRKLIWINENNVTYLTEMYPTV